MCACVVYAQGVGCNSLQLIVFPVRRSFFQLNLRHAVSATTFVMLGVINKALSLVLDVIFTKDTPVTALSVIGITLLIVGGATWQYLMGLGSITQHPAKRVEWKTPCWVSVYNCALITVALVSVFLTVMFPTVLDRTDNSTDVAVACSGWHSVQPNWFTEWNRSKLSVPTRAIALAYYYCILAKHQQDMFINRRRLICVDCCASLIRYHTYRRIHLGPQADPAVHSLPDYGPDIHQVFQRSHIVLGRTEWIVVLRSARCQRPLCREDVGGAGAEGWDGHVRQRYTRPLRSLERLRVRHVPLGGGSQSEHHPYHIRANIQPQHDESDAGCKRSHPGSCVRGRREQRARAQPILVAVPELQESRRTLQKAAEFLAV